MEKLQRNREQQDFKLISNTDETRAHILDGNSDTKYIPNKLHRLQYYTSS